MNLNFVLLRYCKKANFSFEKFSCFLKSKRFGKKAMFFTLLVIFIMSLFFVSFTAYVVLDRAPINKRIVTLNDFGDSLKRDIQRQIYISGYRAVLSLVNHINFNGVFVDNVEDSIEELLIEGSIDGEQIALMENFRLQDWDERVSSLGESTNLEIDYNVLDVEVYQNDPWKITIKVRISALIRDQTNIASWDIIEDVYSDVSIINFEDPIYLVETNGVVANKITQTPYEIGELDDCSNFLDHVENSYYQNNSNAPSFLKRLEGDLTADENGIESFVYVPDLITQGITPKSKSWVDYIYFSDATPENSEIGCAMPSGFKIDSEHKGFYNLPD